MIIGSSSRMVAGRIPSYTKTRSKERLARPGARGVLRPDRAAGALCRTPTGKRRMSHAPPDDPIFSDRPIRRQKKSLPLIVKILLGLVGCGFLLLACCAGFVIMGIVHKDENPDEARARKQALIVSGEQGFNDAN